MSAFLYASVAVTAAHTTEQERNKADSYAARHEGKTRCNVCTYKLYCCSFLYDHSHFLKIHISGLVYIQLFFFIESLSTKVKVYYRTSVSSNFRFSEMKIVSKLPYKTFISSVGSAGLTIFKQNILSFVDPLKVLYVLYETVYNLVDTLQICSSL